MSWDQSTSRESVDQFLMRELGINLQSLIDKAIEEKLAEKDLSFSIVEDKTRVEGDVMFDEFNPIIIRFSDGRVFTETITESTRGDDLGNDYYSFVEVDY